MIGGGGSSFAEDLAAASGDWLISVGGVRNDVLAALCDTDGDYGNLQISATGALYTVGAYKDDEVHASGDYGSLPLAVRTDVRASLVDTTADYSPLQVNNAGELRTRDDDLNTAIGLIGASVYVDDADWTDDTSSHMLVGGLYQSVPQSITDGDVGPLQVNDHGNLIITILSDDPHFGAVGTAADIDGVLHGQQRYLGDRLAALETLLGVGTGVMTSAQAVTLATDDTQFGAVGAGADPDGNIHGQLRSIAEYLAVSATGLGKAIDGVVGATDTGVALLALHESDVAHLTSDEGDYDILRLSNFGALQVAPEQHHLLDSMNVVTGWAALGNDTLNLATTKKHVLGTDALEFDKVNGDANTVFAGIEKTITTIDLGGPSPHDLIQTALYLSVLTNVDYAFVRLGTDASNYNEWRISGDSLTAGVFETLLFNIGDASYDGIAGNGWNPSAVSYAAIGIAFDAETNTLAGIVFDEISFHTNQHTSAELNAEVSSSVSSANVNLFKVGGSATDKNSGNKSNGSQRVVLATDDINTAAIKASVEIMDDWDEADRAKVVPASGNPAYAADVAGADAYASVVTAPARICHYVHASVGDNGAIISLDAGSTDHFALPANTERLFPGVIVGSGVAIHGKNLSAGNNYTNLRVSVW